METQVKKKRQVQGVVKSRSDKTVRIRTERRVKHPLYGKVMRLHTHLLAHDENNRCQIGDTIVVEESPRFSKKKAWRVIDTPAPKTGDAQGNTITNTTTNNTTNNKE